MLVVDGEKRSSLLHFCINLLEPFCNKTIFVQVLGFPGGLHYKTFYCGYSYYHVVSQHMYCVCWTSIEVNGLNSFYLGN
jgi:hypothetical protein